jgi:hypothetical protein
MWLFTETGFVSVVQDRGDSTKMWVRARDEKSLQPFVDTFGVKIVGMERSDYPHRVSISRTQFVDWLIESGETLNYDNYKNRVAKTRGYEFVGPLHDMWVTMLQIEDIYS